LLIWRRRLLEAGLVDEAKIAKPVRAPISLLWVRGDGLEKIERTDRGAGREIPEAVLPAGPDDPGILTADRRLSHGLGLESRHLRHLHDLGGIARTCGRRQQ